MAGLEMGFHAPAETLLLEDEVEFPCSCIASKIWDAFFGPFGPFGPFLQKICDAIRRILRHTLNLIGPKRTNWTKKR